MAGLVDVYADLRRACDRAGGQKPFAAKVGVSVQFVSAVLNGKKPPSARLLKAIGYVRRVTYERSNQP